jgi:murein DD-endopeptidase MepM/ murein hydrolase activator NlpD
MNPLLLWAGIIYFFTKGKSKKLSNPLSASGKITSAYGERTNPITGKKEFHNGIDIEVPVGSFLKSPANGKVLSVYESELGGLQIVLLHDNSMKTGYAHLSKALVKVGEKVSKGKLFALTGKSGKVTGAHLHFSLRDADNNYLNPAKYISF